MTVCCIQSSMRIGTALAVRFFDGHVSSRHPALGICDDLKSIGNRAAHLIQELYHPTLRVILALTQPE